MRLPFAEENKILEDRIVAYAVNHLPIIKEYTMKIGLVDVINQLIPSQMEVAPGTVFLGMILDTLSGRTPLYRLDEFFKNQDTELLLGTDVKHEHFNDHNVARVLDKAYEVGTCRIFSEISWRALKIFDIDTRHVSFDTTSITVFGEYSLYNKESVDAPFKITHGHSKDHRPDLKQFLISMLCVDRNIPVFGKTKDGNGSDKVINNEALSYISKHMARHGLKPGAFIYIADSAMVTEANLLAMSDGKLFISRLPATYKECGRVITEVVTKDVWEDLGVLAETPCTKKRPAAKYRACEGEVLLYGMKYRAIVVHSSAHDKRRQKRLEKELSAEYKVCQDRLKVISQKEFFCFADAKKAAGELLAMKPEYYFIDAIVKEAPRFKKGRPKGGVRKVQEMRYCVTGTIKENKASVERFTKEAGCFVLLTNVPKEGEGSYNAYEILKAYKDQHGIEQNFGFLKDPVIVNSIFLKKAERIEVLGLVLLLSLLIWRLIEYALRKHIEKSGKDLPGWNKRRTERPTSFMFLTKFLSILILKIGSERRLNKPFTSEQKEYLAALNVKPEVFVKTDSC